MFDNTKTVISRRCPNCGDLQDAVSAIDGNYTPSAGDVTVCVNCGLVETFTPSMVRRKMTVDELHKLPHDVINPLISTILMIVQRGRIR